MLKPLKFLTFALLLTCASTAYSQSLKFGHIDLNALIQVMPEMKAAEKEFNDFQKDLEEVLTEMQQGYSVKLKELEALGNDASEVKRNAKFADIQGLQQRIQNYQATAQQQAEQKYQKLLKPVYDKAVKAIEEVAAKQGLIYVFDSGVEVILYKSNQSTDILPMVKQNLGIK